MSKTELSVWRREIRIPERVQDLAAGAALGLAGIGTLAILFDFSNSWGFGAAAGLVYFFVKLGLRMKRAESFADDEDGDVEQRLEDKWRFKPPVSGGNSPAGSRSPGRSPETR